MKNILVTGGSGKAGRATIKLLLKKNLIIKITILTIGKKIKYIKINGIEKVDINLSGFIIKILFGIYSAVPKTMIVEIIVWTNKMVKSLFTILGRDAIKSGSKKSAITSPYMTKDKLIPIWSEAIISELLVFKILNIFPKKLLGEDFISKFNLSLEM